VAGIPIRRRSLTEKDSPGAAAVELINAHAPKRGFTVETFLAAAAATVNRLPRSQKKQSPRTKMANEKLFAAIWRF
jgi:hypothetical protein